MSPGFTRRPARSKYPMFMSSRRHLTTKPDIKTPAIAYYRWASIAAMRRNWMTCDRALRLPWLAHSMGATTPCAPGETPGHLRSAMSCSKQIMYIPAPPAPRQSSSASGTLSAIEDHRGTGGSEEQRGIEVIALVDAGGRCGKTPQRPTTPVFCSREPAPSVARTGLPVLSKE